MTEVDQQSEFVSGGVEVIQDLGTVLAGQLLNRFDFKDDFPKAHEIGEIALLERASFVVERQPHLRLPGYSLYLQFVFQALLVDRFEKSAPFLRIDLEAATNYPVGFLLEKYVWFHDLFAVG
jgi:hypothetical protein